MGFPYSWAPLYLPLYFIYQVANIPILCALTFDFPHCSSSKPSSSSWPSRIFLPFHLRGCVTSRSLDTFCRLLLTGFPSLLQLPIRTYTSNYTSLLDQLFDSRTVFRDVSYICLDASRRSLPREPLSRPNPRPSTTVRIDHLTSYGPQPRAFVSSTSALGQPARSATRQARKNAYTGTPYRKRSEALMLSRRTKLLSTVTSWRTTQSSAANASSLSSTNRCSRRSVAVSCTHTKNSMKHY